MNTSTRLSANGQKGSPRFVVEAGFAVMKIILTALLIPLILLVLTAGISQLAPDKPPADFLVIHNFVDLEQIDSFSKFRSCAGHRSMPYRSLVV